MFLAYKHLSGQCCCRATESGVRFLFLKRGSTGEQSAQRDSTQKISPEQQDSSIEQIQEEAAPSIDAPLLPQVGPY